MIYQEQFQLDFKKITGSASGGIFNVCSFHGQDLSMRMLSSILTTVDLDNLKFLLEDINLYLDGQDGDFFHAFDGMDETIDFQGNLITIGNIQFNMMDLNGILSEWIEFCEN